MDRIYLIIFLLGVMVPEIPSQSLSQLRADFIQPPREAYPKTYWWWLNGHIDTVRIREEIHAMHDAGLSGFDIFDIGVPSSDTVVQAGAAFLGEESLTAIKTALELAKSLGMQVGLNMASSWNAGGAWVKPEHAAKSIYFSMTGWKGELGMRLTFPSIEKTDARGKLKSIEFNANGRPVYYEEIAVLAVPDRRDDKPIDPAEIIDVSSFFDPKTEKLNWNEKGSFQIYRYICSNSGEQLKLPSKLSAGPIIDHFDASATEAHFNYVLDKIRSVLPEGIEHSALKSLYLASYEATGFTWTPTLPDAFFRLNGYEIYPFIPALFDEHIFPEDITASFQADFRRTLSELMIDHFYRVAKKISNANGLKINSESGGPGFPLHNVPVEPLKSLGVMDLPRGEFWINHNRLNADGIDILRVVKEVSSASHIYGRGIVEEEAFTTFQHWQEGPFEMKPAGDRAFCEGMNKVVMHGSSHNPRGYGLPGIYYGAGTHFNDRRIWWPKVRSFTDYLARISLVGQQCDFVADVLYYYGDAIPNYTGHKNSRFKPGPGYDYEVINTEILKKLEFKHGKLELPTGAKFDLLVLADEKIMHPEIFQKIGQLAGAGARITGSKPDSVAQRKNLADLRFTQKDIQSLWQEQGITDLPPPEILRQLGVGKDFSYSDDYNFLLDYIHYTKNNIHFYFIRNTTGQWINRNCFFRQQNKQVEIWNPLDGSMEPAILGKQVGNEFELPISFPPFGSAFIVFYEDSGIGLKEREISFSDESPGLPVTTRSDGDLLIWDSGSYILNFGDEQKIIENYVKTETLSGAWEVFFPEGWGAPDRVIFPELRSWTEAEEEGIKYFSGMAKYRKTFQYDIDLIPASGHRVFLDLGDLNHVAEVWLNDQPLGTLWAKPYRLDISEVLKPGDNSLVIEVANTWNNRLKGDAVTGNKFTHTNITHTNVAGLNKMRLKWSEVPLIKSGLLGPVTIITLRPVPIDK